MAENNFVNGADDHLAKGSSVRELKGIMLAQDKRLSNLEDIFKEVAANTRPLLQMAEDLRSQKKDLLAAATKSEHIPVAVFTSVVKTLCVCLAVVVIWATGVKGVERYLDNTPTARAD